MTFVASFGLEVSCLWVFCLLHLVHANTVCFSAPNQAPPSAIDLPLCGNGILDRGETCDDGNRIGGDGCNAWCSAFDAMSSACTLAGRNMACPFGKTVVGGGAPSKAVFCDLRAVDTHPKGLYVIVADASSLLQLNLFTDSISSSLKSFTVTIEREFSPICSLSVMDVDLSILTYECNTQNRMRLSLVNPEGTSSVTLATFDDSLNATTHNYPTKMHVHKDVGKAVIAGLAKTEISQLNGFESCIRVFSVSIPSFINASTSSQATKSTWVQKIADISCIVYNVIDAEVIYPTFSIKGMIPKHVRYTNCPHVYLATSFCYEVHLQRNNDLQIVKAFIPESGGVDIAYYSRTNLIDNVFWGNNIVKSGSNNMQYTLHSNCLQAQHMMVSPSGKVPPKFTFGNACKNAPTLGMSCALPFNNPFVTDVISSPYLLPDGLSSTLTHADLVQIFSDQSMATQNVSISGAILYKNILHNLYGNSTPVDFVQLPNTMDIVYITPISIAIISSKRFTLYDPNNPGYCRATDVIYCPSGFYGTVQYGVCHDCTNKTGPGYGVSIAWQVMCATLVATQSQRRLLQASDEDTPLEKFSMLLSRDVDEKIVYDAICLWLGTKGETCPKFTPNSMSPKQQYNMAADLADSGLLATPLTTTLISSLVKATEQRIGYSFRKANIAEYMASWTSRGTKLTESGSLSDVPFADINVFALSLHTNITRQWNTSAARLCLHTKSKGFIRGWLECILPLMTGTSSDTSSVNAARRLLQTDGNSPVVESSAVELQGLTLLSTKRVLWNVQDNAVAPSPPTGNGDPKKSNASDAFPLWIGAVIGTVCGMVVIFLLFFIYTRQSVRV